MDYKGQQWDIAIPQSVLYLHLPWTNPKSTQDIWKAHILLGAEKNEDYCMHLNLSVGEITLKVKKLNIYAMYKEVYNTAIIIQTAHT